MMYLNTIETCQIATSRFAGPGFPDENYRRELLGKVPGLAARGVTAALLFPVEVLNCLRSGRVPERSAWSRWMFSAVIVTSGIALLVLSRATFYDGHDRTSAILGYLLTLCVATLLNGRLQTRSESLVPALAAAGEVAFIFEHRGHGHHGHHGSGHHAGGHHGGGFFGGRHHGHHPRRQGESTGLATPAESAGTENIAPPQSAGVCTGNCRECTESICLKSGRPKPERTV